MPGCSGDAVVEKVRSKFSPPACPREESQLQAEPESCYLVQAAPAGGPGIEAVAAECGCYGDCKVHAHAASERSCACFCLCRPAVYGCGQKLRVRRCIQHCYNALTWRCWSHRLSLLRSPSASKTPGLCVKHFSRLAIIWPGSASCLSPASQLLYELTSTAKTVSDTPTSCRTSEVASEDTWSTTHLL